MIIKVLPGNPKNNNWIMSVRICFAFRVFYLDKNEYCKL